MKPFSSILGVLLLVPAAFAVNPAGSVIQARTTYHQDGSRTETVNDPETKVKTETTYDPRGVVTSRHQYLLNERGQVIQGSIYDGAGNLVARSQSYFDDYGRVKESCLFNLQGECFQQSLYEYGADGKAKKPKVINYNVKTPTMRPAVVDFTGTTAPPGAGESAAPTGGATRGRPTGTPAPQPEQPKKSFFKRLFDKKEKK